MSTYVKNWAELPEVQTIPNNYRTSMAGLNAGVNRIRVTHPMSTSTHVHQDSEQIMLMLEGRIKVRIDTDEMVLGKGDVCVIPKSVPHSSETIGEDALFYEVFAPLRVQNLIGFV